MKPAPWSPFVLSLFLLLGASCAPAAPAHPPVCANPAPAPAPSPAPTAPALPVADAAPKSPPPADIEPPKSFDLKAIDDYVARFSSGHAQLGLSLAILRDGKVVLARGYGKSSLAPSADVSPDTVFAVGSITKQFACAAVLLLAEDGKLKIDDKVAKYYPDLTRAKDITLYDLLTHQSGYRDYYPLDFVDREMESPIEPDALIKRYAAGRALDFEPRARFSYSNTGFIIAGRVVEKVSGETFEQFLGRRIKKPLGMNHTFFEPKPGAPGVAAGHTSFMGGEREAAGLEGRGWLFTAGGLYSTATDLALWDLGLIEGKVLKPKSYDLMTAPRKLADGTPNTYACGLGVSERGGEKVIQHSGAVSGFLAFNMMVPRTRSGIVLLANADDIQIGAVHANLVSLLLKDHRAATAGIPAVNGPPPNAAALALIRELQAGAVDRTKLGDDYSRYLDEAKIRAAAARWKGLGEPSRIDVEDEYERGGMRVAAMQVTFKTGTMRATLYRTPDGKIQQLLLYQR